MTFKREVFKYNPDTKQMETVYAEEQGEFHYVQSDEIAPVLHPVDGKYYTSKAAIRNVTRNAGLIEAGTEKLANVQKFEEKRVTAREIAQAATYAREYLSDPRNLRAYRENERHRIGELRERGLADD